MLSIDPDKVCYVIVKAREYDVKVAPVEPDPGSNPTDEGDQGILSDYADDPTYEELKSFISGLNQEEAVELVALTWMGRGDFTIDEWADAVSQANDARNDRTAEYLLGIPLLSDYLEEALSLHGHTCEDFEMGHL
jgi:hypothetical protein